MQRRDTEAVEEIWPGPGPHPHQRGRRPSRLPLPKNRRGRMAKQAPREKRRCSSTDTLLLEHQVSGIIGVSRRTLVRWRKGLEGPNYIRLDTEGGQKRALVRYWASDIALFLLAWPSPDAADAMQRLRQFIDEQGD